MALINYRDRYRASLRSSCTLQGAIKFAVSILPALIARLRDRVRNFPFIYRCLGFSSPFRQETSRSVNTVFDARFHRVPRSLAPLEQQPVSLFREVVFPQSCREIRALFKKAKFIRRFIRDLWSQTVDP